MLASELSVASALSLRSWPDYYSRDNFRNQPLQIRADRAQSRWTDWKKPPHLAALSRLSHHPKYLLIYLTLSDILFFILNTELRYILCNFMTCRRNSSIELLRLLLMFLIVLGHCIIHGLGLYGISPYSHGTINHIPDSQILFAMIIYCFCTYAVNCFILISGYFGINLSKKKFLSLLFALIFYSIFLMFCLKLLRVIFRTQF